MVQQPIWRRVPLPVLLGLIVLVIAIPWIFVTGKSERDARLAIETYDPFTLPQFQIKFSRTMKWDPQGLLGRGVQANFWKWTPTGIELTDNGRKYFGETPEAISCLVGAGRRVITKIESFKDEGGKRLVNFMYHWTEVTPPARSLLSTAPDPDKLYDGRAVLVNGNGQWRVESMQTPHFDKPMAILSDESQGILR
jgi:hypothetical protein